MSKSHFETLDTGRLRREAKQLLKQLRLSPPYSDQTLAAAARMVNLRRFAHLTPAQLLDDLSRVQLKHALTVIAVDYGYASWAQVVRSAAATNPTGPTESPVSMYEPGVSALINRWFSTYAEARDSLDDMGGYLLPYRRQFYITERAGIELLGLDPDDSDWRAIDWDWVKPSSRSAWERLDRQRRKQLTSPGPGMC